MRVFNCGGKKRGKEKLSIHLEPDLKCLLVFIIIMLPRVKIDILRTLR